MPVTLDDVTLIREPRKRRLFEALVERHGAVCQWCGVEKDLTVDHIDHEGPTMLENLQILCRSCNSHKGTREDKAVRWSDLIWQRGFTMVPNAVLLGSSLSAGAFRVYCLFLHYAHLPDDQWPGQDGLARITQMSERRFRDAIRELESEKLIQTHRRGLGKTNAYVLLRPRPAQNDRSGSAESADLEAAVSADPTRARKKAGEAKKKAKRETSPPTPPSEDEPPQVAIHEGRNLPLDALLDECGIDAKSRQVGPAVAALNGRGKTLGIRHLFWVECRRQADATDQGDRLDELRGNPGLFAELLADRIRRKVALIRERQPWRKTITPRDVADLWLDVELQAGGNGRGLSADEIRAFRG